MTEEKNVPDEKQETPEEFVKAYNELCNKYGYRLTVSPSFKLRDDGTFSVVLQYGVEKTR